MKFMQDGLKVDKHLLGFIVFAYGNFEIVRVVDFVSGITWFAEKGEIVVDVFDDCNRPVGRRWRKPIDDVGANRGVNNVT